MIHLWFCKLLIFKEDEDFLSFSCWCDSKKMVVCLSLLPILVYFVYCIRVVLFLLLCNCLYSYPNLSIFLFHYDREKKFKNYFNCNNFDSFHIHGYLSYSTTNYIYIYEMRNIYSFFSFRFFRRIYILVN